MTRRLTTTLAQTNFTVGDIAGNLARLKSAYQHAVGLGVDLVISSEMAITGYPPEDLVLRPEFQEQAMEAVQQLAALTKGHSTALLAGGIWRAEGKLYNSAFLLAEGTIKDTIHKKELPNYGVFDEKRHFHPSEDIHITQHNGVKLGVLICEDMWETHTADYLRKHGATLLVVLNASPYETNKSNLRLGVARRLVRHTGLPLIYVNQTGGQDELVFDGGSFALTDNGELACQLPLFEEAEETLTWRQENHSWQPEGGTCYELPSPQETTYLALKTGLKDYVEKNGFPGVIIGLSGGIDSAVTAAIACDALGKERVHLVMMPSRHTSQASLDDAKACAEALGTRYDIISIAEAAALGEATLAPLFKGTQQDITEENLQSRLRGVMLMALSNKFGYMVLTTGNKSEMAVGYATLYGDMCGGYNVLKDLYKTEVYALSHWRNKQGMVIPETILTKAPSAELRPDQTDQDSLPPYDELDAILHRLIELRESTSVICKAGFEKEVVERVARLVKLAEYKRRQAPPGVKLSALAFGRDRRYPITHRFRL